MLIRLFLVALFAFLSCGSDLQAGFRNWTHRKTQKVLQAEAIGFSGKKVRLMSRKGEQLFVRVSQLTVSDQRYLKKLSQEMSEAERLFSQGADAFNNGLYAVAKPRLLKASEKNSKEIKAEFALGMLAIGVDRDPEAAGTHFENCIKRWKLRKKVFNKIEKANYAAALNNLALIQLRNKKVPQALSLWRQAIAIQDETPQEIIQNLGTVAAFAVTNMKAVTAADIAVPRKYSKQLDSLYSSVKLSGKTRPYESGVGWLYMTYLNGLREARTEKLPSDDDRYNNSAVKVDPANVVAGRVLRKLGTGTGLVVDKGYVLTNKHVVLLDDRYPFQAYKVYFGPDFNTGYDAEIVSYSSNMDLGLLQLKSAPDVTPIRLLPKLADRGHEVYAAGFPKGDQFGLALTVTKGAIARHPVKKLKSSDPKFPIKSAIWHDAIINSGNSGGPLLSKTGIAVGVNFAMFNPEQDFIKSTRMAENYSLAVSSVDAFAFAKQSIPNLKPAKSLNASSTLNDAQKAVVYIEMYVDGVLTSIPRAKPNAPQAPNLQVQQNRFNAFEDRDCLACTGTQMRACTNRRCKNGVEVSYVTDTFVRVIQGRRININKKRKVINQCGTCRGKKQIACQYSRNGVDPRFGRPRNNNNLFPGFNR